MRVPSSSRRFAKPMSMVMPLLFLFFQAVGVGAGEGLDQRLLP